MPVFLIITSLSLLFYLGLLVFLYRDGRKRRSGKGSVYKIQAGSVAELSPLPTMVYAGSSSRRRDDATVVVRFLENIGRGRLKSHAIQSQPAKVITLTTFAHNNDDAPCG